MWLVIIQRCSNASVSSSAPVSLTQIWIQQLMIWRTERSNHAGVIVLNIEKKLSAILFCLLESAFKIHLTQKSEGGTCPLTLNGHDASVYACFPHLSLTNHSAQLYSNIQSQWQVRGHRQSVGTSDSYADRQQYCDGSDYQQWISLNKCVSVNELPVF